MMRNLADLSRWILESPQLKEEWGEDSWKTAFNSCNSPAEWEEFKKEHGTASMGVRLQKEYERIDAHNQTLPRSKIRGPLDLPDLG